MYEEAPEELPPTFQHELIARTAGVWDVDCEYFLDPANPIETKAVETITMLGPFWAVSRFEGEFMGKPFVGAATLGFDPMRGMFVSTWVDSKSPHLNRFEGSIDETGKVLTLEGENQNPMSGEPTMFRAVEEFVSSDTMTFKMNMDFPGMGDIELLSYVYTRRS